MKNGKEVREACRNGAWQAPTSGLAPGFVQANLVMLPRDWAYDFLLFCQRNPKPCPLLEVLDTGNPVPRSTASEADLRTDLPGYRIWENGELIAEPHDVLNYWRDDLVSFLIGCSFTFENALLEAGLPVRHIDQNRNVPMYRTNISCESAGRFHSSLVVSMRPMRPEQVIQATRICTRFPRAHGVPVHIGDPGSIGIPDIHQPDFGDAVEIRTSELPVFWACGVTPQVALASAKPPFAITHQPGHMFLTDWTDADLAKQE